MSRDRVRFFLHYRYYDDRINVVMYKAFGMDFDEVQKLRAGNAGGFWIICRPSQFARFLIYRDAAGIANGFKDLNAALVDPRQRQTIANHVCENAPIGVTFATVKRILTLAGIDPCTYVEKPCTPTDEVEVWKNNHEW